jgi:hypothetical protein
MAPNGLPRWNFTRVSIGILVALLVVLGVVEYRQWAEEQREKRAAFDVMLEKLNGAPPFRLDAKTFPAPPFDSNDIHHCFALSTARDHAIKRGLIDAEKAERLIRLFATLPPPKETSERPTDVTVTLGRLLAADRLIETGDRAAVSSAFDRCAERITAELAK